jgi:hypothetical protein
MKINCRLYTPADFDNLIELWNENADWGLIDREQWEKVFHYTPYGPATIVLATAEKTDEILAQFVFFPLKIFVHGKELNAFKPCAPVMRKSVRTDLGLVSFLKMYRYAIKHFTAQGVHLFYMMPDPRWARGFQMIPGVQVANFPLWCLPLNRPMPPQLPEGYAIESISPTDARMNDLWAETARLYNCSIVRDTHFFSWKLSHRGYQSFGVTCDGRIVGFAAFLYKKEIKGIAICDVLAENEEALALTLQLACVQASAFKDSLSVEEQAFCEKVTILATPLIQKLVEPMGFEKNSYKFSLAVHVLGKELPKKELKPENWYVSAND